MLRLDPKPEPVIWAASNRFGALPEKVVLDPAPRDPDFDDASLTENSRSSCPIEFVPYAVPQGRAGHPRDIAMLACDAFGVLPPVARLNPGGAACRRQRPRLLPGPVLRSCPADAPRQPAGRTAATRTLLRAARSGGLDGSPMRRDAMSRFGVRTMCPGVDPRLLDPVTCWPDPELLAAEIRPPAASRPTPGRDLPTAQTVRSTSLPRAC